MLGRRDCAAVALLAAQMLAACGESEAAGESPATDGPEPAGALRAVADQPWRAVWVTRFDYRTQAEVEAAIDTCATAGFNRVLFQVRGSATAFYRSAIEPWADELGGADPGFDPLEVAIDAARARGVELHAWINVMPAWWGAEPPANPAQLYNARPEWLWRDQEGRRAPLVDGFYASINPCLPEVREYLAGVLREILAGYELDGLHLDYVRFPNEAPAVEAGSESDYPRDARTLELYRAETGRAPDDDAVAWTDWRCECVTKIVRAARELVDELRPGAWLTAAVGPAPGLARERHFQDTSRWLREDLLDAAIPMNYSAEQPEFEARLALWSEVAADAPIVMGLSAEGADPWTRHGQLARARTETGGFSLFCFASLFDSPGAATAGAGGASPDVRARRREVLLPLLAELAAWDRGGS